MILFFTKDQQISVYKILWQYKAKQKYGQFEKEWTAHLETERKRAEELK